MKQLGEIRISNRSAAETVVEIEGVIGVPEWWQFDDEAQRVATYDKFRTAVQAIEALPDTAPREGHLVRVRIRSIGGDVGDALLIHDALCGIAEAGATIITECYGYVASAATVIAQAASEGERVVSPNSLYLIHNATTAVEGNSHDAARTAELLGKTDRRIASIYARRAGRPEEEFLALMARDNGRGEWLSPDEVLAERLADRIGGGQAGGSPLAAVRDRVRAFFGRSGAAVNGAVMRLFEPSASGSLSRNDRIAALEERIAGVENRSSVAASEFQSRIAHLESENALLRTRPSATLPREDPAASPVLEAFTDRSPNRGAYDEDARTLTRA